MPGGYDGFKIRLQIWVLDRDDYRFRMLLNQMWLRLCPLLANAFQDRQGLGHGLLQPQRGFHRLQSQGEARVRLWHVCLPALFGFKIDLAPAKTLAGIFWNLHSCSQETEASLDFGHAAARIAQQPQKALLGEALGSTPTLRMQQVWQRQLACLQSARAN